MYQLLSGSGKDTHSLLTSARAEIKLVLVNQIPSKTKTRLLLNTRRFLIVGLDEV